MAANKITARYTLRVTGEHATTPEGEPRVLHTDDLHVAVTLARHSRFECEITDNSAVRLGDSYMSHRDPFRKVLDHVEQGDVESLVFAVNIILGAQAASGAKAAMITAAVDVYRLGTDDEVNPS